MATGSVALIYTNAMGGYDDNGDNGDNLKLSLAGATEMPRNIIAHELLGFVFCPRIARMDTNGCYGLNGDRVGRTNWH